MNASPRVPPPAGFAAQFTPDGDGFFYLRSQKGRAIRVTGAERTAFLDAWRRATEMLMLWCLGGGIAAVTGVGILRHWDAMGTDLLVAAGVIYAIFGFGLWRAWGAPERALADRPEAAPELTRREAFRQEMARTSWWQLAYPLIWSAFAAFQFATAHRPFRGLDGFVMVCVGLLTVAVVVQAVRKLSLR